MNIALRVGIFFEPAGMPVSGMPVSGMPVSGMPVYRKG